MFRSATATLCLLATPALADLTAEEVLADHLNLLSGYGALEMETTGTQMSANGLVVEGFTGLIEWEQNSARITTPGMVLTEEPDGSVTISYGDRLPVTIVTNPGAEDENRFQMIFRPEGLTHRVSGSAKDLMHKIAFDRLTLEEAVISPPEAAAYFGFSGGFLVTGFDGMLRYQDSGTLMREIQITLDGLTQDFDARVEADVDVDVNGSAYASKTDGQLDSAVALSRLSLTAIQESGEIPRHAFDLTIGALQMDQRFDMAEDGNAGGAAVMEDLALSLDLRMSFDGWQDDPEQVLENMQSAQAAVSIGRMDQGMDFDLPDGADETGGPLKMKTRVALNDLGFEISYDGADVMRHGASLRIGNLDSEFATDVDTEGAFAGTFDTDALTLAYDLTLSPEDWETDLLAALLDGQSASGSYAANGFGYDIDMDMPDGAMEIATRYGPSETRFSFDRTGVAMMSTARDVETRISGPILDPAPISSMGYSLSRALIDFAIPLTPSETAQPFHTRVTLDDLVVDDALWNLIDPGARLDRSPARLVFDLDGTTIVNRDLFGPEQPDPFGATKAQLRTLVLDLAGVAIDGTGAFDGTLAPAAPEGEGRLDLTMTGVHELMDLLIELGLLPEADAMGARMMLGLFARPGANEGELVSKIEINEAGEIYANGQRIR